MKKIIIIFAVAGSLVLAAAIGIGSEALEALMKVSGNTGEITIVIDPGHGGIDGGAETAGGVCEKDINLSISKGIKRLAEDEGWIVLMTREEDKGLYSDEKGSVRNKKSEDLKKRRDIINGSGADAAVSIHLNSYPSQTVKGAQTFYPKNSDEGKEIAELIQNRIRENLDSENERTSLAKDDIIIMKNNTVPLVLVECGFLSNKEEAEKLQNKDYQSRLSAIIFESLKEYFINIGKVKKEEISLILSD